MFCNFPPRYRVLNKSDQPGPGHVLRRAAGDEADPQARRWGQHGSHRVSVVAHRAAGVSHGGIQRVERRDLDAGQSTSRGAGAAQHPRQHDFARLCRLGHDASSPRDEEQT